MDLIELDKIIIKDRGRTEFKNIESLAESLGRLGQIQPIVLDRDNNLIAGERRIKAAHHLNWTTIGFIYRDQIDDLTRLELELEENIQRDDLTWPDRARMTAKIDAVKRLKYGSTPAGRPFNSTDNTPISEGWSTRDTSISINTSQSTVSRHLTLARILEVMPELEEERSYDMAIKKFDRYIEMLERELSTRELKRKVQSDFLNLDAVLAAQRVPDKTVDLVLIDPPYGTDIESIGRYAETHFNDTKQDSMDLLRRLAPELFRITKDDAHLYCFCGIKDGLLAETTSIFTAAGFHVDDIHLVWIKSTLGLCDFDHRYAPGWEPILYVTKDAPRRLSGKRSNVFVFSSVPIGERVNQCQKPTDLLEELIKMSTQEGELVYDAFAGSGSALVAAKRLGRRFAGSELDADQYNAALLALYPPVQLEDIDLGEESPEQIRLFNFAHIYVEGEVPGCCHLYEDGKRCCMMESDHAVLEEGEEEEPSDDELEASMGD